MKKLALLAILLALLLVAAAAQADVTNVSLTTVGTSGVTGMATAIVGGIGGPNPYQNVEINIKMDKMPAADSVYEAWLIDNQSNTKLSLGVTSNTYLTHRMKVAATPWDAIAVSVEPARDMNPTPCTIVAQGNLPGTPVASSDFATMAVLPPDEPFQKQLLQSRYNLSDTAITNLRMNGWSYSDIALASNVAAKCNRNINDVVSMVSQGQSWDQIASSCNMTTAQLFEPMGVPAVPGAVGAAGVGVPAPAPGMMITSTTYLTYPNGRPVVSWQDWQAYRAAGYEWRDVAAAANIAAQTGENVDDLLRMTRVQGRTWNSIAFERGLPMAYVEDVSRWPFGDNEGNNVMIMTPSTPGGTGMGAPGTTGTAPAPSETTPPSGTSTPGTMGTEGGTVESCPPATGSGY